MTGVPREAPSPGRFLLTVAVWVAGLFGAMRLAWVQEGVLLPFARLQQRLATDLMGAPPGAVVVDLSCTGADALALCVGFIAAVPVSWRARVSGGVAGVLLIVALNVARIGSLALVADRPGLLAVLHLYVWPALLIVAVVAYVFVWITVAMRNDGPAPEALGLRPSGVWGRGLVLVTLFVGVYFVAAPWLYESRGLETAATWSVAAAATLMRAVGVSATAAGALVRTPHGAFVMTPECLATPLVAVYAAAVLAAPRPPGWRAGALALGAPLFFGLGTVRLLVLALPPAVVPSPLAAIHAFSQLVAAVVLVAAAACPRTGVRGTLGALAVGAGAGLAAGPWWDAAIRAAAAAIQGVAAHDGHRFADPQGAFALLPAFQLGLLLALGWAGSDAGGWRATGVGGAGVRRRRPWLRAGRPWLVGLAGLAAVQVLAVLVVGELSRHVGFDPHVGLIRAWGIVGPLLVAAALARPAWRTAWLGPVTARWA